MKILQFDNISLKIGKKIILQNISLDLQRDQITTLIGPNGGGKTSIAQIAIGAVRPSEGKIHAAKNLRIGYMPQKITLDKTIPLRVVDFLGLQLGKNEIENLLKNFSNLNIEKILYSSMHDISGGELQKILFLYAIAKNPDLLVLDEPTQYMDINAIAEFYHLIAEVRNHSKCAILLISHDLNMVMQKSDFVFCINKHVCCEGAPESINDHPEYRSLFGGKMSDIGIYKHQHNHLH